MSKIQALKVDISNNCSSHHYHCENCGLVSIYSEDEMSFNNKGFVEEVTCCDCGEVIEELVDIDCACYEYMHEYLIDTVALWSEKNPAMSDYILISGDNIGWRNRSGWKVVDVDTFLSDPSGCIGPNSSWSQTWTITPKRGVPMRVVQSHHDSPCGESYNIRILRMNELVKYGVD